MKILISSQLFWHMVESKRSLAAYFIEVLMPVNESTFLSISHRLHILLPLYWVQNFQWPEDDDGALRTCSKQGRIFRGKSSYRAIKSILDPVRCLLWQVTGDQSTEILPTTWVIRCWISLNIVILGSHKFMTLILTLHKYGQNWRTQQFWYARANNMVDECPSKSEHK